MYINKGKRDILIFPKFNNLDKIQIIRNKYDKLSELIAPHITLIFPFYDEMSNNQLVNKLTNILSNFSCFNVTFQEISISNDNYIFLNCINGNDNIIKLHDKIYNEILPNHLNKSIKYIPHITLGQTDNISDLPKLADKFETLIDAVSIELIGANEESIIIKEIKLK